MTLYCGDAMLIPFDNRRKWLDMQTKYVFWGPVHNGNKQAKWCSSPTSNMFSLTLDHIAHPPQQAGGDSASMIVICPKYCK
jgi:hypothetical protein